MLNNIYHKRLEEDLNIKATNSTLNNNDNLKVMEMADHNKDDDFNIQELRAKIKAKVNNKTRQANKHYDEEKTLISTIIYAKPNKSVIDSFKDEARRTILENTNFQRIFYVINKLVFDRTQLINHKKHNGDGYIHNILNAIYTHKHIPYPILKANRMIDDLHFYCKIAETRQKTTNYLMPRTELYLFNSTYDLMEVYSENKLNKTYINQARKQPIELYLYALQQTLTNNGNILGMTKYTTKKLYENNKDFTSNYLYYTTQRYILRFKLLYIITLEKEQLPFTDLNYYLFRVKWNIANPIEHNFIVVVKLDMFNREHNTLLKQEDTTDYSNFTSRVSEEILMEEENKLHGQQHTFLENIYYDRLIAQRHNTKYKCGYNTYHRCKNTLARPTFELYITELTLSNKIKNMLDTPKLSQDEIDELFNPKQLEQQQEDRQTITHNIIYSSSDSDSDEEEKYENIENPQKTIKDHNKPFNLIFKYNKNYYFSNDEKYLIVNAYITKYNTSKKLQELTNDYEVVMVIKPIHKHYTHIKYFNFILTTHDNNYYTKQYHAYLNEENNITNITEITNTINNII
jgi:hypothetical protein